MFDWKLIATVIIVLIVLFAGFIHFSGFVSLIPGIERVNEILKPITGLTSMFSPEQGISRPIQFSLQSDSRGNLNNFSAEQKDANISIALQDTTTLKTKTGSFKIKGLAKIRGFSGQLEIVNHRITLYGEFSMFETEEISITNGKIEKFSASFSKIEADGLQVKQVKIAKVNGSLKTAEANYDLSNKIIEIYSPMASFTFDDGMNVNGLANRILIKDGVKISISG